MWAARASCHPVAVSAPDFRPSLTLADRVLDLSRPALMGVVNANPDSFSDPGHRPLDAILRARDARAQEPPQRLEPGRTRRSGSTAGHPLIQSAVGLVVGAATGTQGCAGLEVEEVVDDPRGVDVG